MRGFILLPVIIILQIISLLSFFALKSASDAFSLNHHFSLRYTDIELVNSIMNSLEEQFVTQTATNCIFNRISTIALLKKTDIDRRRFGCGGNSEKIRYYYIAEFLGNDPCAQTIGNKLGVSYYRITMFADLKRITGARVILQSLISKASFNQISCHGNIHPIKLGKQWRRELN